jgi:hypothetical protein
MVCVTPQPLHPRGKRPRYQLGKRVGGFRAGLDNVPGGYRPRILASRYTDWGIPAYIIIPSRQSVLNICSWTASLSNNKASTQITYRHMASPSQYSSDRIRILPHWHVRYTNVRRLDFTTEEWWFDSQHGQKNVLGPAAHSASYLEGTLALSLVTNQLGREAPSAADVKNEWSYIPTPPYVFAAW